MNEYVLHSKYGPGGKFCFCCGPGKYRKKAFEKRVKRKVRQKVRREILKQIKEMD